MDGNLAMANGIVNQTEGQANTEPLTGRTDKKWMVLRGKDHGNVFWTTGGDYNTEWYELLFASDDEKEVSEEWFKRYYGR